MKYQSLEQIALEADVHSGTGHVAPRAPEALGGSARTAARAPAVAIEGTEFEAVPNARPSALTTPRSPWHSRIRSCGLRGSGATGLATRSSSSTSRTMRCIAWSATVITG